MVLKLCREQIQNSFLDTNENEQNTDVRRRNLENQRNHKLLELLSTAIGKMFYPPCILLHIQDSTELSMNIIKEFNSS